MSSTFYLLDIQNQNSYACFQLFPLAPILSRLCLWLPAKKNKFWKQHKISQKMRIWKGEPLYLSNYACPTHNWIKTISLLSNHKFDGRKSFRQFDSILIRISNCIKVNLKDKNMKFFFPSLDFPSKNFKAVARSCLGLILKGYQIRRNIQ